MKLNYCPECAEALDKLNSTVYRCSQGHEYFNNPRAACAIIFINSKNELLYAKRGREPMVGKYDFPGGFLDYGEDAYQAVVREVHEEMGVTIDVNDAQLIDSESNYYQGDTVTCDFIFVCRKWRGEIKPDDDVAALEWKPLDFLRSDEFAWEYPHLFDKLQKVLGGK